MIWRIILWGSLIWLPYLMYRVLGGEAKFTKNIAVGVTMPFEGREDADVCIVLPYIPYLRCNRDLKRIKRSRGWAAGRGDTRTVDLKAVQEPRGI